MNNEKKQNLTDIISRHWDITSPKHKTKDNTSSILFLDNFFEKIVKNEAIFNFKQIEDCIQFTNNPKDFNVLDNLTLSSIMSHQRYHSLLGKEIHQEFLESSLETNGFTQNGCLNNQKHLTNLKNMFALKILMSSTLIKEFLMEWKPNYFELLQKDNNALIREVDINPEGFKQFLLEVDQGFKTKILNTRKVLDNCHFYILRRNNKFTSDCSAYNIDLTRLNVPLIKIKSILPFTEQNEQFLSNVFYFPISDTHSVIAVPTTYAYRTQFPGQFKHLIEAFIHSNLPEYIAFTNSKLLVIPSDKVNDFITDTTQFILSNPFDYMLMSRALSTIATRNIDYIIGKLQNH